MFLVHAFFDDSAAEIPAFDATVGRRFVTNNAKGVVNSFDIDNPSSPMEVGSIPMSDSPNLGGPNSVAVRNGVVAIAVENATVTDAEFAAFDLG